MEVYRRRSAGDATDTGFESISETKRQDEDGYSIDDDSKSKKLKLTILEEVFLLGLKDRGGYLSFWNDNISYVLRGCILIELALRNRITVDKESMKRPYHDRILKVVDSSLTGEVILDEALKLMKQDKQSVGDWIDLLSGETWNVMKVGYQLKQVRERIAKGLVDKGVLRTEKKNFVIFDMATHPLADSTVKEEIVHRVVSSLLGIGNNNARNQIGPSPSPRTLALLCATYAANVLENALVHLSHSQREACFNRVDEILQSCAKANMRIGKTQTDIITGVIYIYSKMDSVLY
ncbi:Golgi phosphoprotein 3 domain-containing protein [Rozella allomycis CSF55]|uniref:Golgi phosphoprotein 3 domain-containing protein n=1 Tax=Rozella allomycis (strain CSF55) TaxID=988480 RepID=A0A075B3Z4_ROZAC|nr:Golgi phosphoprotein 3 domain-containing protein [Rozella allomycis CSF55]|eukprot:EPZ35892.1 Golgi phosphoprotein 3 domain-containing protein [Rozella allomycis CSF55]